MWLFSKLNYIVFLVISPFEENIFDSLAGELESRTYFYYEDYYSEDGYEDEYGAKTKVLILLILMEINHEFWNKTWVDVSY